MNTAYLIYQRDEEGSIDPDSFGVFVAASRQTVEDVLVERKRAWLIENDIHPEDAGLPFEFEPRAEYSLVDTIANYWLVADDAAVTTAHDSLMEYNEGWFVAEVPILDAVEG